MNEAIRTEIVGDYRISVYYDEYNDCPCTEWCMAGLFIWGIDGYGQDTRLCSACNWRELFGKHDDGNHTVCDALRELIAKHVPQRKLLNYLKRGKLGSVTFEYNRGLNMWEEVGLNERDEYWSLEFSPQELKDNNYIYELTEYMNEEQLAQILYDLAKDLAFTEWSSTGYCQGDYVHGYAFCTKERFAETCDRNTKNWKAESSLSWRQRQRPSEDGCGATSTASSWRKKTFTKRSILTRSATARRVSIGLT